MTFILAWKENNHAYCIADTAITGLGNHEVTSFGQVPHSFSSGYHSEEKGNKIFPISDKAFIAYSGNSFYANKLINKIIEKKEKDIVTSLKNIVKKINIPHEANKRLTLFLFQQKSKDEPKIFIWDSRNSEEIREISSPETMGSLSVELRRQILGELNIILQNPNMTPVSSFHYMITSLQRLGISNLLLSQGVGGSFFGAQIGPDGFSWQKDITYIIYPPSLLRNWQHNLEVEKTGNGERINTKINLVLCAIRDNSLVIYSTFTNELKFISNNNFKNLDLEKLASRWTKYFLEEPNTFMTEYVAFLSASGNQSTIIKQRPGVLDNEYFKIHRLGKGQFDIDLKVPIYNHLLEYSQTDNWDTKTLHNTFLACD